VITIKATITVAAEAALIKAFTAAAKAVAEGDVVHATNLLAVADHYAAML
jgi:hypothetical protein